MADLSKTWLTAANAEDTRHTRPDCKGLDLHSNLASLQDGLLCSCNRPVHTCNRLITKTNSSPATVLPAAASIADSSVYREGGVESLASQVFGQRIKLGKHARAEGCRCCASNVLVAVPGKVDRTASRQMLTNLEHG